MIMQSRANHRILLSAIVAGVARWEPVCDMNFSRRGNVCVNEMRHSTCLDDSGCPILSDVILRSLRKAMTEKLFKE